MNNQTDEKEIEDKLFYISLIDLYIGLTLNEIERLKCSEMHIVMDKFKKAHKQNVEEMDEFQHYLEQDEE